MPWGWRWLDELRQDIRHGLRVFARSKSFALTAVLVVALGSGLNLALFQMLNQALVAPLQVREPETLIRFFQHSRDSSSSGVAYPVTQFVKRHTSALAAVFVTQGLRTGWGRDAHEQVEAALVSANYFDELGAGPAYGRVLYEGEDDRPGASPAVVLSHEFWKTRLGGDVRLVGTVVYLNGRPFTVAGIATEAFNGTQDGKSAAWIPLEQVTHLFPGAPLETDWGSRSVQMYARLRPGVSEAAARQAVRPAMEELGKLYPREMGVEPHLETANGVRHFRRERDDRRIRNIVALLVGVGLLVLTVACANLASLMISHMHARLPEVKMRAALGAGTGRVLRQLVTEASLLVGTGVVLGWFLGYMVAQALLVQTEAPFTVPFWPDGRMMMGLAALGWIVLVMVGVVPAWRALAARRLAAHRERRAWLQRGLIGAQVLGSCVLLLVGGIMARKLQSVVASTFGFNYEKVAVLEVSLNRYGLTADGAAASGGRCETKCRARAVWRAPRFPRLRRWAIH